MSKLWIALTAVVALSANAWSEIGLAEMKGTAEQSPIKGTVQLEDTSEGLKVRAQFVNVPPGKHGFHIHEFGFCSEQGKAAGSHYNPANSPHGHAPKDGAKAHPGDLGNVTAEANGTASLEAVLPNVRLTGAAPAVAGRAVVLHEKADDFSQPVGNAGGRIACAPILITGTK